MNTDERIARGMLYPLVWAFPILFLAAWITHVIDTIADGEWLLLIAGAIAFPVGIIHGIGIWFGVW